MTNFVIITPTGNPKKPQFAAAVAAAFPDAYIQIADGQYFASKKDATSSDIERAMGGQDGSLGQFAVVTIGGYSGWHRKDLWEWLRVRGSEP